MHLIFKLKKHNFFKSYKQYELNTKIQEENIGQINTQNWQRCVMAFLCPHYRDYYLVASPFLVSLKLALFTDPRLIYVVARGENKTLKNNMNVKERFLTYVLRFEPSERLFLKTVVFVCMKNTNTLAVFKGLRGVSK